MEYTVESFVKILRSAEWQCLSDWLSGRIGFVSAILTAIEAEGLFLYTTVGGSQENS